MCPTIYPCLLERDNVPQGPRTQPDPRGKWQTHPQWAFINSVEYPWVFYIGNLERVRSGLIGNCPPPPPNSRICELSLCFGKCKHVCLSVRQSVCLSICLSVCPHGLYFRTLFIGRYIRSLHTRYDIRTTYSTLTDLIY